MMPDRSHAWHEASDVYDHELKPQLKGCRQFDKTHVTIALRNDVGSSHAL